MVTWHLKKEAERKFRSGHPWVFSNELAQSPKGIQPGEIVELRDQRGAFLARGYGHPNSLISFRALTRGERESIDAVFFKARFEQAARARRIAGVAGFSHRFCFAEGDFLPGLVIDRYMLSPRGQVFVVQSSTAGMDQQLPAVFEAIESFVRAEQQTPWDETSIVVANDSKSRALEGIAVEAKRTERVASGFAPEAARLVVQPSLPELSPLVFTADLIGGQKTGFFLDQRLNISLTARFASGLVKERKAPLRVLDLCCYVGQWGTQLAHLAKSSGVESEVTLVDASARALEMAAANVESHGGRAIARKLDVLEALDTLEARAYDVVICDPPAFIKKKKDIPTGSQAYFKMNRSAIQRVAVGGIYVSCSCSGLFEEEEFRTMLARVAATYPGEMRWLARGGHSPDHPQRPEFPQGTYLKSWIGLAR